MLTKTHNKLCNYFVRSASHDILDSIEEANERIVKKVLKDQKKGSKCISLNFVRAKSLIEENKFLLPIGRSEKLKYVPIMALQIINDSETGISGPIVGSEQVGAVVNQLRKCFDHYNDKIVWTHEGEKLSLANSITKGVKSAFDEFSMNKDDFFYFVPLDIPLFYDLEDLLIDNDIKKASCILDFNAKESIFAETPQIFLRNYYHTFINDNKEIFHIKEPNVYGFSAGLDFEIVNEFYNRRQNGGLNVGSILKIVGNNLAKGLYCNMEKGRVEQAVIGVIDLISEFINYKTGYNKEIKITKKTLEGIGYYVFNKPIIVKAQHQDPFRLRDIDAWHDLKYYWIVLEQVKKQNPNSPYDGLETIYPHARQVIEFNDSMKEIKENIPILSNFSEYAKERFQTLNDLLPGLKLPNSFEEWVEQGPEPGEDIKATVEVLKQNLHKYNQNKSKSCSLKL